MRIWIPLRTYLVLLLILGCILLAEWKIIDELLIRSYTVLCEEEAEEFRANAESYVEKHARSYVVQYFDENKKKLYKRYSEIYGRIREDIRCFPVEKSYIGQVGYSDSWYQGRSFGGERKHEGTDIMSADNVPGAIPVVSMTDGEIKNMGWLTLGGWRLGIEAPSGIYYYYAHLDSYASGLQIGDTVHAGELLGFMGNSGYGEEGTTGMFDVHLHVGIYLYEEDGTEVSVNPYPFLLDAQIGK